MPARHLRIGLVTALLLALGCESGGQQAEEQPFLIELAAALDALEPEQGVAVPALAALGEHHLALLAELEAAMEAAGALEDLGWLVEQGGSIGFGAYDANGIFDPFGTAPEDPASELGNAARSSSFYVLFGPEASFDPFDVGLPGREQDSSPFMPDVASGIGGIAYNGTYTVAYHGTSAGLTIMYEKYVADDHVTTRETFHQDGGGYTRHTLRMDGDQVTHYTLDKWTPDGVRVYGEEWTSDGTLTIYRRSESGEETVDTVEGVDYSDIAPEELANPDYAPDLGCVLPWLCDETTPGELLMAWSDGAKQEFDTGEGADLPLNTAPPIVTLFDVLHNPGYLDGLYILDDAAIDGGSGVPRDNPWTQY